MNDTINSVGPGMVEPSQPLSPELKKALTVLDESVKSLGLRVFSLDAEQASRQDVRIYVYQVSTGLHKEAGLAPVESVTKLAEEFIFLSDSQAIDLVSNLSELAQQEKKLSEQMEKVLDLIDRDLLGASRGVLMDALGVLFLCSVDTASIEQAIDAGISAEVLCSLVLSKLESHETRLGRLSEALNLQPLSGGSLSHVQRVMSECVKIEKRIDEYEEKEILQQQYKTLSRIVDLSEVRKQATLDVVLSESGQARIRILLEDEMSFFPSEELEKPSGTFKCCTRIVDYHALSDAASLEPVKRGESLDAHEVWIQQLLYGLGVPNIPEVLGAGTDFIVMERGQYCLADRCRGFVNLYSDDEVQLVALEISKTLVGMESVRVNISTAKMLMPTEKKRLDAMQNQGNLTEEEKEELRQNVEVFAQIVHRDIKPRNIVYNPDDT
ncbi:MAG: hypothetical protein KDK78_07975, partial [Chlamydiia bacterium]|nr:hypothetical protein [Chlamydiia bacterium]